MNKKFEMKQLIACCVLDCEKCEARLATLNDDNLWRLLRDENMQHLGRTCHERPRGLCESKGRVIFIDK